MIAMFYMSFLAPKEMIGRSSKRNSYLVTKTDLIHMIVDSLVDMLKPLYLLPVYDFIEDSVLQVVVLSFKSVYV